MDEVFYDGERCQRCEQLIEDSQIVLTRYTDGSVNLSCRVCVLPAFEPTDRQLLAQIHGPLVL